jgi:FkbM family methyltransferase
MRNFLIRTLLSIRPAFIADWLKRLAGIKRQEIRTEQGRFFIDPVTQFGNILRLEGVYEPGMVQTLEAFLKLGEVFLDVGANEGYFSVIAARLVGSDGRVIAVEPQSRLIPVIRKNAELNKSNIEIHAGAISDKEGEANLLLTPSINSGASSFTRPTKYQLASQQVGITTLTNIIKTKNVGEIALMKMDIEGHEYEAILGSPAVFKDGLIRAIALELHPRALSRHGHSVDEITSFLIRSGYKRSEKFTNNVFVRA